jgi:5-formyltetrahydrofolate cyclo-ligase
MAYKQALSRLILLRNQAFPSNKRIDIAQKNVIRLVEKVLAVKRADAETNTCDLEREIDQQVYTLFGLSPEEIAIVENTAS